MTRIYCTDLPDYMPSCCGSCHEDEEYGYDMLEVELGGDTVAVVCCTVAWALEPAATTR